MKKSITKWFKALLLLVLVPSFSIVKAQTYNFTIENDVQVSDRILEFDLFLLNTNPCTPFELSGVQAGIPVNPSIYNGGTISLSILPATSELNTSQAPASVVWSQVENTIKLTPKAPPGAGSGTILGTTGQGTKVCRLRVTNTVPFGTASPNLTFNFTTSPYPTKVAAYISGINTQLTSDATNCFSNAINAVLNEIVIPSQTYNFTIENDIQVTDRILEFDLYLLNTNPGTPFELSGVQAGITINPAIYNGGTISLSILAGTSELNTSQAPTSVVWSQAENTIKLTPKAPPGAGSGTILGTTGQGTRVCRLRVTNTVPFATASPNLTFNFATIPYPTKVAAYISGINTELTSDATNCFSNAINALLNDFVVPEITGNNNVCEGSTGNVYTTQEGMTNYVWSVSAGGSITGGGTVTDNSITITWDNSGNQSVSVNFTHSGLTPPEPTIYPVTVNPSLPASVSIAASPAGAICAGHP